MKTKLIIIIATTICQLSTANAAQAEDKAAVAQSVAQSALEARVAALEALVEGVQSLREKYHGGRVGQYILTNELGRIQRVDLYRDATTWTNEVASVRQQDPEAAAKRRVEALEADAKVLRLLTRC